MIVFLGGGLKSSGLVRQGLLRQYLEDFHGHGVMDAAAPEKLECRTSIDSDVQLRLPHSIMVGEQAIAGYLVGDQ